MGDSNVPLAAPTGNADTRTNAAGEHRQVMVMGNDGDTVAGVEPYGAANVSLGPTTTFYEQWNSFDTNDKWTLASGAAPTITNGEAVSPATVSTYNAYISKPNIPANAGFQYIAHGIRLEGATPGTGAGRFWGVGTQATTPSATSLAQNGIGFEIDQATGTLYAVTYNAGSRTLVSPLTRPTDGGNHRYALYWRVTQAYWFIDNMQVAAATTSWPGVPVQELPVMFARNNGPTLANSPIFVNVAALAGDTARDSHQISDGDFPWRKAEVGKYGGMAIKGASLPSSTTPFAAAGTGIAGPLDITEAGNVTFIVKNTVAATAYTGTPVVVFEQSDDNVSWAPLIVVRNDNNLASSTHVLPAGAANTSLIFDGAAESINYVRARVTTGTTANGMTIVIQAGGLAFQPVVTNIPSYARTTGNAPGNINVIRATGTGVIANTTTLVATPGANLSIYVTDIVCSNAGGALTTIALLPGSAATPVYDFPIAATGGGATVNLQTPWKLAANTGLFYSVSVATTWYLTVSYFVGP